jgi:hypothetical protein
MSPGLASVLGLAALVLFVALLLVYSGLVRRQPPALRQVAAFRELGEAIERSVESGQRVHLSLGSGGLQGPDSAVALAGLSVLARIAERTSMSDRPAVVTSGDGAITILAQDTLRSAYDRAGARERFRATSARMLGPTPLSYLATLPAVLATENVSVHMLNGSFGAEGGLAADFGRPAGAHILAGSDDVPAQAAMYAVADQPLVGEELFAAGAYLGVGPSHVASLRAQDAVRFVLIAAILVGMTLRTLGFLG